jgi:hypothetical protein
MQGKKENTFRVLMEKPDGNRQLGRPSMDGRIILKLV